MATATNLADMKENLVHRRKTPMRILVLNGSTHPNGNTVKMIGAFSEGATESGHQVDVVDVTRKNIKGCIACEFQIYGRRCVQAS